ncbi:putative methyltransferase [Catenovulum agarivorans DS-2]|uniref:Carboxy-S-adenosyl-L-methionine synthase n=1 Tax=Catenovulum agarivorans DS-2 TaxID=1328313 RepID=W7R079_9ALTE|nr:carboxy-S-adenosyl-L-methionine synthase CmoA [Catenovulum agarivorans]EWH11025.1 putative methyltransferase [Catenovulum agarivorans DS-2]
MTKKDNIYANPQQQVKDFVFDDSVVDVFSDMIERSVPGYQTIISTIGHLAQSYVTDNSNIYDLGASLGAASLSIRRNVKSSNNTLYAIDYSQPMAEKCKKHLLSYKSSVATEVQCADALKVDITNASMVVLNFTLQFIAAELRSQLIENIYQGLKPGGILVLSEKLTFPDDKIHQTLNELHLDFKRAHGYSELEISQKRTAIENVMKPDSLKTHYNRLKQAGFKQYNQWYQCFNFCSIIAIKD